MMVYIDLLLIKIYMHSTLKKHFLKNYMEKVYIYVVKYENLLKKILLVI